MSGLQTENARGQRYRPGVRQPCLSSTMSGESGEPGLYSAYCCKQCGDSEVGPIYREADGSLKIGTTRLRSKHVGHWRKAIANDCADYTVPQRAKLRFRCRPVASVDRLVESAGSPATAVMLPAFDARMLFSTSPRPALQYLHPCTLPYSQSRPTELVNWSSGKAC